MEKQENEGDVLENKLDKSENDNLNNLDEGTSGSSIKVKRKNIKLQTIDNITYIIYLNNKKNTKQLEVMEMIKGLMKIPKLNYIILEINGSQRYCLKHFEKLNPDDITEIYNETFKQNLSRLMVFRYFFPLITNGNTFGWCNERKEFLMKFEPFCHSTHVGIHKNFFNKFLISGSNKDEYLLNGLRDILNFDNNVKMIPNMTEMYNKMYNFMEKDYTEYIWVIDFFRAKIYEFKSKLEN